jgi:hypothetical protein
VGPVSTPILLPEGTRLLHIGPHKTGTTTVQAAFHQNREELRHQGIHYAGSRSQPMSAAMAAARGTRLATDSAASEDRWSGLVQEIDTTSAGRTVISSEFFCEADEQHIRTIVTDLGIARTHVVVTLRPLVKILASQWQQYMQNRLTMSYDHWLEEMLHHADTTTLTPSFWRRHRHDALIARWADVVGIDNLTVVVVDEQDKRMLMRTFEQMLALPAGTLVPHDVAANRSLTYAEAEMLRAFNTEYRERDWSEADYTRFVRFGAARYLQQRRPGPEEARVLTPQWAVRRAVQISEGMCRNIAASGVRVVGDLDSLSKPLDPSATGDNPEPVKVPVEVAACFSAGLVDHIVAVPPKPAPAHRAVGPIEEALRVDHEKQSVQAEVHRLGLRAHALRKATANKPAVDDLTARQLLSTVGRRMRRRAGRLRRPVKG